ncbi:MAG: type IV fimbrial biogenesis protein FimT [Cycloclasticus pugetii]|jgi:type IV fimbrial biogenesis protein FimT|uniref:GspH/FimT family pseudopilin n=1 Tax=Cycloclasticus TaxID=34067 RepID=UPI000C0E8F5C|nr:GspH/FimT family pseudopilin [Cycloclasticus sp.]PHR50261.1 MAG: general secretion pathway protein GspH [Cycloclasticus sp.]
MKTPQQHTGLKPPQGFTLIELIITIAIAGILLAIGAPNFNSFLQNNRLTTQINELVTSINLARSEAIKRGFSSTICKSNTGSSCAGNWTDGWVVFDDQNADGVVDADETIIRSHGALKGGNTLTFGTKNRITYSSQGIAVGFNDTFKLCDNRGATKAKGIVISNTGRARLAIDSNADGTVEDGSSTNITCP